MKNLKKSFPFLVFFVLFIGLRLGFAELEASPWTAQKSYADKISHKLGFGFLNTATGWTALLFEPAKPGNKFIGLVKGIGYTISNTAGGLIHAATFPIPVDLPLAEGGISYEYKD